MIPVILVAAGVAAAAAGVAAGKWISGRVRRRRDASAQAEARKKEQAQKAAERPFAEADAPVALGDVVVLDEGRGTELWVARCLVFAEAEGEPFLFLFEADGPEASRAIVAFDPLRPEEVDVLSPKTLEDLHALGGPRTSRPPSTVEVRIEEESITLSLLERRTALARYEAIPSASGLSELPRPGEALLVATYAGGVRNRAVAVRTDEGRVHAYVGKTIALATTSVLRNREDQSPAKETR